MTRFHTRIIYQFNNSTAMKYKTDVNVLYFNEIWLLFNYICVPFQKCIQISFAWLCIEQVV